MASQVVELTIDANNNIIDRRVSPHRYTDHREAVAAIEHIVATFAARKKWKFLVDGKDGKSQVKFIVESSERPGIFREG
jgi:hypothetical protein